jgi:3-oxoacid CoA-transferase subunit A
MDKTFATAAEAVADIPDGATLAVGGFGLVGVPIVLIRAILEAGATALEVVSNNCGVDGWGLGLLLSEGRIRRIIASYIGENKEFARQYLSGAVEVELTPQGTLAERLRAGGTGIPAFYTPTGVGTVVSDGGMPWLYHPDGTVAIASPPKPSATFDSLGRPRQYVLEEAIRADYGIVRAARGDRHGNLVFEQSARNFNPLAAMSGRTSSSSRASSIPTTFTSPASTWIGSSSCHQPKRRTCRSRRPPCVSARRHRESTDGVDP